MIGVGVSRLLRHARHGNQQSGIIHLSILISTPGRRYGECQLYASLSLKCKLTRLEMPAPCPQLQCVMQCTIATGEW